MRVPEVTFGVSASIKIYGNYLSYLSGEVRELIPRSFLLVCFSFCFVLFCLFFLFSLSYFFLPATKFGLLVLLHFMIRSLHLRIKSEISKCFLTSAADNDNDKLRNVLQL